LLLRFPARPEIIVQSAFPLNRDRIDVIIKVVTANPIDKSMIIKIQRRFPNLFALLTKILSLENILALILALILIAIYITTAADAPIWLYQGF